MFAVPIVRPAPAATSPHAVADTLGDGVNRRRRRRLHGEAVCPLSVVRHQAGTDLRRDRGEIRARHQGHVRRGEEAGFQARELALLCQIGDPDRQAGHVSGRRVPQALPCRPPTANLEVCATPEAGMQGGAEDCLSKARDVARLPDRSDRVGRYCLLPSLRPHRPQRVDLSVLLPTYCLLPTAYYHHSARSARRGSTLTALRAGM